MKTYTLITGATSGIGHAFAVEFAKTGKNLIIASRNLNKMKSLAKELIQQYKIEVKFFKADLGKKNAAQKLYDQCNLGKLRIETLINNAGIGLEAGYQIAQPPEEVKLLLQLNIDSVVDLATLFGKDMVKNKTGNIVNISSTGAFQPMPYAALYGASKAFVLSFSEAMHIELKPKGVGVTAICPGLTDTNFFRHGKPTIPSWLYKIIPPEQVAKRGIKAMRKNKPMIIPHFQHWLFAQIGRFLSHNMMCKLMKFIETRRKNIKEI